METNHEKADDTRQESGDVCAEEDMSLPIVVILPAAGTGTRMNIAQPKQFCLLQGRPVISHTLQAFEK